MSYKDLILKAEELLGTEPEIEKLASGKYVVMYMNFNTNPPPTGETPEEALTNFLKWYEENKGVEDEA